MPDITNGCVILMEFYQRHHDCFRPLEIYSHALVPGQFTSLYHNVTFVHQISSRQYFIFDQMKRNMYLSMHFQYCFEYCSEVQSIMSLCNHCSATWPMGVQRMANQYLHNPIKVNVGSLDLQVSMSFDFNQSTLPIFRLSCIHRYIHTWIKCIVTYIGSFRPA